VVTYVAPRQGTGPVDVTAEATVDGFTYSATQTFHHVPSPLVVTLAAAPNQGLTAWNITATVTLNGSPAAGVEVALARMVASAGPLSPLTGVTAADGTFTATLSAADPHVQTYDAITARASAAGWIAEASIDVGLPVRPLTMGTRDGSAHDYVYSLPLDGSNPVCSGGGGELAGWYPASSGPVAYCGDSFGMTATADSPTQYTISANLSIPDDGRDHNFSAMVAHAIIAQFRWPGPWEVTVTLNPAWAGTAGAVRVCLRDLSFCYDFASASGSTSAVMDLGAMSTGLWIIAKQGAVGSGQLVTFKATLPP